MRRSRWIAVLATVAILAAACGGSSDDSAENGEAEPAASTTEDASADTASAGDEAETESAGSTNNGSASSDGNEAGAEPEVDDDPNAAEIPEEGGADEGAASTDTPVAAEQVVRFTASDGVELEGTLFGSTEGGADSAGGLVLAHMRGRDRSTWLDFARDASAAGLRVLTFDFRGYGGSAGQADTNLDIDLASAIDFLRAQGTSSVVAMGASMGGTATVNVASKLDLAGAVSLSAPADFLGLPALEVVSDVNEPLLLVAAENDEPYASAAVALDAGASVSQLQIYSGNSHGTNLFGDHDEELTALLLTFATQLVN